MAIERTIPLMFKARVQACPDIIAQASKNEKGEFEKFTYARLYKDVIQFAAGLKKLGIRRADNVAFFSDNRREWLIADLAILSLGAIDVPRGKDSMAAELRFITSFAGCVFGIFENSRQLEKILEK
ncbi:MAG: AMP-binding protein, partial [Spirochaetaceae bacterium]|nr:AMP-binding protein [Spirochaetaceae bacterium]